MFIANAHAQVVAGQSSGAQPAGGELFQIGFLIVLFGLFYFIAIRPQRKRQKEHSDMVSALKKGDEVVVISGDHKGSKGKVLEILRSTNRVLVEGVNLVKRHEKKTQENPQGAIVEREASIHFSNVRKQS